MQQNINMGVHHVDLTSPIPTDSFAGVKNNEPNDLEREEGEIIEDEFEDIISSDEELSMRKRIEELEARNAELEKIANISGIYNYEISSKKDVAVVNDRNPLATIDLSDLEDYTTKSSNQSLSVSFANKQTSSHLQKSILKSSISYPKRDTHRGHNQYSRYEISDNYNFIPSRRNSSNRSRRQSSSPESISSSISPVPKPRNKKQRNNRSGGKSRSRKNKSSLLKSTVQSTKKSTTVYEDLSSSDEEFCALNRNELRLALKRDNNTSTVPNRGNFKNSVSLDKKLFLKIENSKIIEQDKIEKPISNYILPDETVQKCDNHVSSDDSVSLEEQELRLIALKSAVVKKHLARKKRKETEEKKPYSPSDFDNIKITPSPNNYDTIGTGNSMDISPIASPELILSDNENTKPIDMDLVNSSDSDEPIFVGQEQWMPIQEIPLPNELNEPSIIIHSPQPRKLLNNEETLEFINSLIDSNSFEDNHNKLPETIDLVNDEDNTKIIITSSSPEPTDEEELALRTLLLAKMNNSPKVNKNNLILQNSIENSTKTSEIVHINDSARHSKNYTQNIGRDEFNVVENEVDALRNLILNTMRPNKKTASVLKEAVRRLKNSTNETIQSDDVPSFNDYLNSYQQQCTNLLPENIDLQNHNLPQIVDQTSYLVNIDNSVYDNTNIQFKQHQQLLPSYFEHNNFQIMPNFISNISIENSSDNRDPIRPALKIIPIKDNCQEKIISDLKKTHSNDNLIELPLKSASTTICQSSNLKEISLTNSIVRTESKISTDSNEKQELISIQQEKIIEPLNLPNLNNIQSEQSLKISKQIESLKKLSNTIQQTTEISIKSKIPLARKSAPRLLVKNPPAVLGTVVTKKIVNANKVINQSISTTSTSTVLKRKTSTIQQQNDDAIKKSRLTLPKTTAKQSSNNNLNKTRLVTNLEVPTVKRVIINLGNSSATDSEDEFYEIGNVSIENKYNDNASPMSVQMESPYYSPNPSSYNSPCPSVVPLDKIQHNQIEEVVEEENYADKEELIEENKSNEGIVGKSVINDVFQAKLDQFLKNARTKVESVKKVVDSPVIAKPSVVVNQHPVTPLAVRHLPESSQIEYRRLVSRMKMLEKQKQAKISNNLPLQNFQVTITNEKASANQADLENTSITSQSLLGIKKTITNDVAVPKLSDDLLIRKVLMKNTNNTNSIIKTKDINDTTTLSAPTDANDKKNNATASNLGKVQKSLSDIKAENLNLLERYETAYHKSGCNILSNIDKALTLVSQGKEEKSEKLLLQKRIEETEKQLEMYRSNLKIHEDKIAKIYPAIANINKVIGNVKCRRAKLHKAATNLGKYLNSNVYSIKDNINKEIVEKFKHLSVEIKTLKNLKLIDIEETSNIINECDDKIHTESTNKTKENITDDCGNVNDKIVMSKDELDNTDNNSQNTIEKSPESNVTTRIDKLNVIENCIIKLTNEKLDNSKLVSLENNNDNAERNHILVVEQESENTATHAEENVTENIVEEILFERNMPTLKTTKLNQKDVAPNEGFHYSSPLDYKNDERQLKCNPHDIICPYQLMGQCDDKDCKYGHLSNISTKKISTFEDS